MKVAIILGTRPEIIKMSPIIRECINREIEYFVLHTGQHYTYNLDNIFFKQLEIPNAKYNLGIGSGLHGAQTGTMLYEIEKILIHERPDVVLVQGDTNTVLAGALAATKLYIKVGHVEAGLRSYDRTMPEEINRVLVDHCSNYLFAPTEESGQILLGEDITSNRIFITGNTIVDALYQNLRITEEQSTVMNNLGIVPSKYFLATIHRQENVDNKTRFGSIISGLDQVADKFGLPIIYPIHPRAQKMVDRFGLKSSSIRFIDPLDYLSFLELESKAKLILTDSGGVQEEACILNVPCVTLRDNTERPETLSVGSNILAGVDKEKILDSTSTMLTKEEKWENPFGNGTTSERIVDILGDCVEGKGRDD